MALAEERDIDLVALDKALAELAAIDPQQSRLIELRLFGRVSIEETAEVLGISQATVKREWRLARAGFYHNLKKGLAVAGEG